MCMGGGPKMPAPVAAPPPPAPLAPPPAAATAATVGSATPARTAATVRTRSKNPLRTDQGDSVATGLNIPV